MENCDHPPLNVCHIKKTQLIINRLHFGLHGIALLALFYYRITTLVDIFKTCSGQIILLPHFLLFISELILSFIWLVSQPSKWRPVTRAVYPERLPGDDKLPSIDVFVCTADPNKEPCLEVMNTVVSALALDYPPDKLHVYLSDDGGSPVTLGATKQAWMFSRFWVPFCRKYEVKNRCPEAYFHRQEEEESDSCGSEFFAEKRNIEERYEEFKNLLAKLIASDTSSYMSRDHPSLIEVISDENGNRMSSENEKMPVLVYVAREKKPCHPHNFKAGALNVLLRLSAMISNSPYILVLDCDMYCNDPSSARQAMCFHLDPKISPKLGWVQFPQKFHNISETHDIYDGQLRYFWPKWEGWDGLMGPPLIGTCFYMKREALCKTREFQGDVDLIELEKCFGSSKELIKSINRNYKPVYFPYKLSDDMRSVASCRYDNGTKWGKEVGFRYFAVLEDILTGFDLHSEGWISVYLQPSRPCFLGSSPITLNELLVQHTRWYVGVSQIALSSFFPFLYTTKHYTSIAQTMMLYAEFAFNPLYFLSFYILALVPQLCLLRNIPLYPQVSSPYFVVYSIVFLSAQMIHVQEILSTGHSIRAWPNEQRIWMMKSLTSYMYATLEVVVEKAGMRTSSFVPTNKVVDDEQAERNRKGIYDFQASPLYMVPLCTLYMLSVASFIVGVGKIFLRDRGEMVMQTLIALLAAILHFPLLQGMVLRKDKGRVSPSVSLVAAGICILVLSCASFSW